MAHEIVNPLTKQSNTLTLKTAGTFVDQDIKILSRARPANFGTAANSDNREYERNPEAIPVIPANGSLFIDAGWVPDMEISLGHLIPDDANLQNAGNGNILKDFEAYDSNGNKLVGTIETVTPTFSGGEVNATASGEVATAPKVTVIPMIDSADKTNYGITVDTPTNSSQVVAITLSPDVTYGSVTTKANASREIIKYATNAQGYINLNGATALNKGTATQDSKSIQVTAVADLPNPKVFIPLGGITPVASAPTIVNPTATGSVDISTNNSQTVTGILTSAPSGDYIKIHPMVTTTNGNAKSVANATGTAGLISAGSVENVTGAAKSITVTNKTSSNATRYIAIYDGSYTVF